MPMRGHDSEEPREQGGFLLQPLSRSVRLALVPGLVAGLAPGAAFAEPRGGEVRAGQATIGYSANRAVTNINQSSQRAAIDWRSFDVRANEQVNFNQPGRNASTLNRIFDQNPSQIFGRVKADGQVVLMNPNGVFFKPGAQVNVGSLVAGAMRIGVEDFMRGSYKLEALKDAAGRVVNEGTIEAAEGGDVTLVGKSVANRGVIVATAGRVNLVAGEQVTVDFDGDGLLRFAVDKAVIDNATAVDDQVENTGEIIARGGDVLITAAAAEGVFENTINNGGAIRAGRIENRGGRILLTGLGPGASVLNTGQIDASAGTATDDGGSIAVTAAAISSSGTIAAAATGGDGGTVQLEASGRAALEGGAIDVTGGRGGEAHVLGERVALNDAASIDASGRHGGGEVLVGGDFQGNNPDVANAQTTFMGSAATIAADATEAGDGGKVILWADDGTTFAGEISARGGRAGGDGGFVEVSGKETLVMQGRVDVTADKGTTGTLLLDPATLNITDDTNTNGDQDTNLTADNQIDAGDPDTINNEVSWGAIDSLAATANVVLEATGLVTVEDVTGNAGGAITQNDLVTLDLTTGSLTIRSTAGSILFADTSDVIRTEGGDITLTSLGAGGTITGGGFDTTGAGGAELGTVTLEAVGGITFSSINSDDVVIRGAVPGTQIDVGDASGGDILVSGTDLGNVTASTVTIGGVLVDAVVVDNLAGGDTADIASLTLLAGQAGGTLTFQTNDSRFNAATAATLAADGGIVVDDVNLRADGSLAANADFGADGGAFTIQGAGGELEVTASATSITASDMVIGGLGINASGQTLTLVNSEGDGSILGGSADTAFRVSDAELGLITAQRTQLADGGTITVDGITDGNSTDAGTIELLADASVDFSNAASVFHGSLEAKGNAGVNVGQNVTSNNGDILFEGDADANNTGTVAFADGVTVDANGTLSLPDANNFAATVTGTVFLAGDTLALGNAVTAGAGSPVLTLKAATAITATSVDVGAGSVRLLGETDVSIEVHGAGGPARLLLPDSLLDAITAAELTIETQGNADIFVEDYDYGARDVFLVSSRDILDDSAGSDAAATQITTTGAVSLTAAGDIGGGADPADVDIAAGAASVELDAGGSVSVNSGTALDDFTWIGDPTATAVDIDITGATTVDIDEDGSNNLRINAISGAGLAVDITTTANDIVLDNAGGDVISSSASVSLDAAGAIDDTGANQAIVSSGDVSLTAGGDIAAVADPLNVQVGGFLEVVANSGSTFIASNGALTIGGTGISTQGGEIAAASPLTIDAPVALTDTTTLTAGNGAGTAGDDLTVNAAITLTNGANRVLTLNAGDDVNFGSGGSIVTGGGGTHTVNINANQEGSGSGDGDDGIIADSGGSAVAFITADVLSLSGVAVGASGGNNAIDVAVGNLSAAATAGDIFVSATGALSVDALTTQNAVANTVDIRTDGTNALTLAGPYTDVADDTFTLAAGGDLNFITNTLTVDTLNASFGQGNGGADIDLDVVVAGTTSFTITGGTGADTLDAGDLGVDLDFTATADGVGSVANGLGASYSAIENITAGSGNDSFAGNTTYTVNGADTGTAALLNGGTGVWAGIENLVGTAGDDTFNFVNGGSIAGTIDGQGDTLVDTLDYSGKTDAAISVTLDTGAATLAATGINGGAASGVTGVEVVVGSGAAGDDTLTGRDEASTWTIDGAGGNEAVADVTVPGGTLFAGFEILQGGTQVDQFDVTASVSFSELRGGAGADVFSVTGPGGGSVLTANLFGEAGTDTFEFGVPAGSPPGTGEDSRLVGAIDGGTEDDTIDFSGSDLQQAVNDAGGTGTITGISADPDLLSAGYADVQFIVGNGLTAIIAPLGNVDTFYNIRAGDVTYGNSLGNIASATISGVAIIAGDANDTFIFDVGAELAGGIDGGLGTNTLMGSIGADTFTVTGGTAVDLTTGGNTTSITNLTNIDSTVGAGSFDDTGADTFDLAGNTFLGSIEGGGGSDTLAGSNNYVIDGGDSGTSTNVGSGWSGIENLDGTSGADIFNYSGATASLSGTIDGISDAGDTITGTADALAFLVSGPDSGTVTSNAIATTFQNVPNLTGSSAADTFTFGAGGSLTGAIDGAADATDAIIGTSTAMTFVLQAADSGTVEVNGQATDFSGIGVLTGSSATDTFQFDAGSQLSGDASGGDDADMFTLTGNATVPNLLGGAGNDTFDLGGFVLTGAVAGEGDSDTLAGSDTFVVTGGNLGTSPDVSGGWATVENLAGTGGSDLFTFNAGSSLSGDASGLGGDDLFTLAGNASAATLSGGDDSDTVDLAGFTLTGSIDGGAGGTNVDLVVGSTTYVVTGAGTGTSTNLSAGTWSNVESLTGTAGPDTFTFNAGGSLTGAIAGLGDTTDAILGTSAAMDFVLTGMDAGNVTVNGQTASFTGIGTLTGSSAGDMFTFNGGSSLTGDASGLGGSDSFLLAGNATVPNLLGGDNVDGFDLGGFTLTGAIAGGDGTDTLSGSSTFVVTGPDTGTSPNVTGNWATIENLTGTATGDSFTFNTGSSLTGDASGLGGNDTFTLADDTAVATLAGGADSDTFSLNGNLLTGAIDGGTGGVDIDTLRDSATYGITGPNSGTSPDVTGGWSNIENLTGTTGDDTFTYGASGSLSGIIDGQTGTTETIVGTTAAMDFVMTGLASGNVTVNAVTTTFTAITTLTGSSVADTFTFNGGSTLPGDASGLGGADVFTLAGSATVNNLLGGSDADSFDLGSNLLSITGTGVDGGAGSDTLAGASSYLVTGADSGTANGISGGTWTTIENLDGTANMDSFTFSGGSLTGDADGLGGNDVFLLSNSTSATTLVGGGGTDSFDLNGNTLTGAIDGGADADTISGSASYAITGVNSGTSPNVTGGWSDVENLTGTAAMDTFTYGASGSLSGTIDGLGNTTDAIVGTSAAMDFVVTSLDAGTVTVNGVATGFTAVETLTGSTAADSFVFNAMSTLTGAASGLGGMDTFTLAGNATVGGGGMLGGGDADGFDLAGFALLGAIDGGGGSDTLSGSDTFVVTAPNAGTSPDVFAGWSAVENLAGTAGADSFTFNTGSSLSGSASGLGGNDTFTLADDTAVVTLAGGDDNDTFDLGGNTLTGAIDGGSGGADSDTLVGSTSYVITGSDGGTSPNVSGGWTEIENLTGTAGGDSFTYAAGGSLSGTIDGSGGAGDLVQGSSDAMAFMLTGAGSGTVTVNAVMTTLSDVDALTGSSVADTFTFDAGSSLSGDASGGGGADMFDLTGNTAVATLAGGAGDDSFDLAGFTLTGAVAGNADTDTLSGSTTYDVTGAGSGTAGGATGGFSGIENLAGTGGADTFTFSGGTLAGDASSLGGADVFNITASSGADELLGGDDGDTFNLRNDAILTATIEGEAGSDTVTFGMPTGAPPGADRSRVIGDINLGAEGADTDTLDFSGSDLAQLVDAQDAGSGELTGTIVGSGADIGTDMLSGTFSGVEDFIGNGKGTLIGPNVDTFWLISATNSGFYGATAGSMTNAFTNFNILGGSGADTVIFDPGAGVELDGGDPGTPFAQVGFNGGGGFNTLVGSTGSDNFTIDAGDFINYTNPGGGQTRLENIDTIDATAGGGAFDGGNDAFAFGANTYSGSIDGGAGSDIVSKTTGNVTATISAVTATGMGSTTNNFVASFTNIETLTTGTGTDNIFINTAIGASGNGNTINLGGAGETDVLRSSQAVAWTITGDGAGRLSDIPASAANAVNFTGVEDLRTTQNARLAMPTTAGAAASIAGTFTATTVDFSTGSAFAGANGLRIDGDVTRTGALVLDADGAGDIDINGGLDVSGDLTSRVANGVASFRRVTTGGDQTYVGDTSFAGDLTGANFVLGTSESHTITIATDVDITSSTGVTDFGGEVASSTAPVLNIIPPAGTDMFVDSVKGPGHIRHDAFENFDGTLVLGGEFQRQAGSNAVLDGSMAQVKADYVRVSEDFITSGDLIITGSAVEFAAPPGNNLDVAAGPVGGGAIAIIAVGNAVDATNGATSDGIPGGIELGDIAGPDNETVTFTGGQATLAASNEILNSTNIIMNLGGGEVLVAQSDNATNQQVDFNIRSNAVESGLSATATNLIASLTALTGNVNIFQDARVFFPNPAAVLTVLQAVSFVDASLFEEDLSLFGVIGNGIALSLDQCEDVEGCAPSVTEEELAALIATLNDRISRLETLIGAGEIDAEEGQRLLAGYRTQLQNFLDYQVELAEYLARQEADEFGDDFGDEFDDVFEAEEAFDTDVETDIDETADEAPAAEFDELEEAVEEAFEEPPAGIEDFGEEFEAIEAIEEIAPEPEPAPAVEPAPAPAPEFEELDEFDEFEELEEELDEFLLQRIMQPETATQLAGSVRIDNHGEVVWHGDVLLPTLDRRY